MNLTYKILLITLFLGFEKSTNIAFALQKKDIFKKSILLYTLNNNLSPNKTLDEIHKSLTSKRLDIIHYVDSINLYVSKEVTSSLIGYFSEREIQNAIFYNQKKQSLIFYEINKTSVNSNSFLETHIDSLDTYIKNVFKPTEEPLTSFLLAPKPEVLPKAKIRLSNQILIKPLLEEEKVGYAGNKTENQPKNIIQIKEVEDYRYYFSEGINHIIYTLRGTNDFLKKTYNIKTLPDNPLRSIVLVVEHTVTRNKYFFFKEEITTEEDLINVFFNQN